MTSIPRELIKIGMIGLDTSHCEKFASYLNLENSKYHIPGGKIVAAYPAGSSRFSMSYTRIKDFTKKLKNKYKIPIYESISEVVEKVDAILLESVDGRQHLDQFAQIASGKPVFIDKPFTTSTEDAKSIIEIAYNTQTPVMCSSPRRFAAGIKELRECDQQVYSCEAFGPAPILQDFPGLFWYGIHSTEILYSFMGKGCVELQCIPSKNMDTIVGKWWNGEVGLICGVRYGIKQFGCLLYTESGMKFGLAKNDPPSHYLLAKEILNFFKTRKSPIDLVETCEIVSFIEAANESKSKDGKVVKLQKIV